ncbi:MAG: ABC transporter permease subunit, partial [Methylococcales bacterium]|nr:ABC transporter permease subunit [Methylococcales bacterium]
LALIKGGLGAAPEVGEMMEPMLMWPMGLINSMSTMNASGLGGFVVIIMIALMMAQEYRHRTLQQWFMRGLSRPTVLGAKAATILMAIFLLTLVPLIVGGIMTAIFTINANGALDASVVNWGELALTYLTVIYTMLPYAAFTLMLAVVTRSVVVAISVTIGYSLLFESLFIQITSYFSDTVNAVAIYLPQNMAKAILGAVNTTVLEFNGQAIEPAFELLSVNTAVIGIGLYTIVFLAIALWSLRRQDLSG